MANYDNSALLTAQALLIGKFKTSEMRFRDPVVHKEFLKQGQIMIPSYNELRTDESRAITAYFANRTSRSLLSTRAAAHTGARGDSTAFSPTWLTNADVFKISLKQGGHNVMAHAEMMANEFQNSLINMSEGMEGNAESHIFSNRSTENAASVQGTFDATDHLFKITETTDGDRAVQITQTVMDTNKFSGSITLFCDSVSHDKFEKQRFQGAGNSENLAFNFNSNVKIVHALGLNAFAAGLTTPITKGFWIAVVDGTIAALPWIPKENRAGIVVSNISTYSSLVSPIDGETYALHSYSSASDEQASGGQKQDVLTQFELSLDVALDNAPIISGGVGEPDSTMLAFGLV